MLIPKLLYKCQVQCQDYDSFHYQKKIIDNLRLKKLRRIENFVDIQSDANIKMYSLSWYYESISCFAK